MEDEELVGKQAYYGSSEESDNELDSGRQHSKLLDAISKLDGKKRKKVPRSEPGNKVSEFSISSGNDQVKLQDLVGALKHSTSHGELKKQLNRVQKKKQKKLGAPLSKPEQERIDRSLAYDGAKKEVSKWDPVVQKNRKADQMEFPLQKPQMTMVTSEGFVKRFQPRTPLELEVAALLHSGSHVPSVKDPVLTQAEERALQAMSLQEAKERRAELQKYRALMSYKEAKAKRQNKIKSKRYRRILRKEREKQEKKSLEELEKADPEAFKEQMLRMDKNRIQERMSLKHRGGSKYMQKQQIFAKYDNQARSSVQEMLQQSRELTEKLAAESESDAHESDNEASVDPNDTEAKLNVAGSSSNPWMSLKKVTAKPDRAEPDTKENTNSDNENNETDVVTIDEIFQMAEHKSSLKKLKKDKTQSELPMKKKKKRRKARKKKPESDNSDEDDDLESSASENLSDSEAEQDDGKSSTDLPQSESGDLISQSLTRKRTLEDMAEDQFEDTQEVEGGPKMARVGKKKPDKGKPKEKPSGEVRVDPKKVLTVDLRIGKNRGEVLAEEDYGIDDAGEEDQQMTIAQAFAEDDVIEEFEQEKQEIAERDKPKDIDMTLPGWGDWGGKGIQPSKRKRKMFTIKAPPGPPRKDRSLGNVIISETKDATIAKHQVNQLPHPFMNVVDFERSIRQPLGKTWTTETAFKELVKPKVKTKLGTVIDPINKKAVFKKQKMGEIKGKGKSK